MTKTIKIIKIILFFSFIICAISLDVLADNGKKNFAYICVRGIMFDEKKPLAIINDEFVGEGDTVQGIKILKINSASVKFKYKGEVFNKDVGEGCIEVPQVFKKDTEKQKLNKFDRSKRLKSTQRETAIKKIISYIPFKNINKIREFIEFKKNIFGNSQMAGIIILLIFLLIYCYISATLQIIAKKTNTANAWFAWIPVANLYLMCRIADRPAWWLLLFFIPLVNIIVIIVVWTGIARACNKPSWLGAVIIVPIVNFILLAYLAFSKQIKDSTKESDKLSDDLARLAEKKKNKLE